jgi:SecD/SecF fusion protein
MQRNHLIKLVLVIALLIAAFVSLYPTFQIGKLQGTEQNLSKQVSDLTGLGLGEISSALTEGNLESLVRRKSEGDTLTHALSVSSKLISLSTKVKNVEGKAIRRGLDLQGGTYLVYEVDLPQLLRGDLAKNKDERLEDILNATQKQVEESGGSFFDVLLDNFASRNIHLNRYYGRRGQSDGDIIKELREQADDAINRTLEILRNRIDQFGVSEPSIQKEGNRRIVIELAGIQDIQRAKKVINTTALLEFKLVKDTEIVGSVLNDIDRVLRAKRKGQEQKQAAPKADSMAVAEGKTAKEQEVSLNDLFGGEANEETAEEDTTILVDQNTFEEKPFTSLLRGLSGRYSNVISVPIQNVRAVQRALQLPEVQSVIPADAEFLFGREPIVVPQGEYQRLYLVKKEPELVGSMLKTADVQIGSGANTFSAGAAEVHMDLNGEGTKIFARTTGMNVGKQLAIVLDGKVASAPNIKEKIPSGSARIDGMGSMDEAKDLALVLRAGALPVPLHVITENTVGPSLGQDSIDKGKQSVIVGLILVILFMVVYYGGSGAIADMALFLNIIFVLAIIAAFHATLTMPGIAGIILTVGMAVDANVLIFERIREELKTGKTVRAAIDAGYNRAFTTILDANVTTLITAVVLYSFGTGPIRGFALTLSVGIIASMFTAIVVTRLVFDIITSRYAIKKLSI